jgi:NADPH-dependent 2,4-dienoyl-CoA reductase/sulfur reductase-like enzyme
MVGVPVNMPLGHGCARLQSQGYVFATGSRPTRVSIRDTPELSLAVTLTVGSRPVRPLTHLPLTNGPLSQIDGGRGSSIVTSTARVCIVAPGEQLLAPQ